MSSAREQFFADNGYSPFADTSDSWNQHRESVQKRFDDFQREADQDRKMMFDNFPTSRLLNGHGMERPFMGSPGRASPSSKWTEFPIRVERSADPSASHQYQNGARADDAEETSSLGSDASHRSAGSPHYFNNANLSRSPSGSSGSAASQPRVRNIPIQVDPLFPVNRANTPENVSRSSSGASHRSASPATAVPPTFARNESPTPAAPRGISREIPVTVGHQQYQQQMPKVRSAGMGQSTSRAAPTARQPNGASASGPYVTRVNVNNGDSVDGDNSNDGYYQPRTPEPAKPDAMQQIADVKAEIEKYESEVAQFAGTRNDKQYRYLDEMLTRCMIKLDNIETEGKDEIRMARKEAINAVHKSVAMLESRTQNTDSQVAVVESSTEDQTSDKMTEDEDSMPAQEELQSQSHLETQDQEQKLSSSPRSAPKESAV